MQRCIADGGHLLPLLLPVVMSLQVQIIYVSQSCETGGMEGMIGTMMPPGYSSCNPAISECATLRGASAWAHCTMVRMRAMPCESSVVLNPVVQHPDHRYVPTLFYSQDYNIWCLGGGGLLFPHQPQSFRQLSLCSTWWIFFTNMHLQCNMVEVAVTSKGPTSSCLACTLNDAYVIVCYSLFVFFKSCCSNKMTISVAAPILHFWSLLHRHKERFRGQTRKEEGKSLHKRMLCYLFRPSFVW